MNKKKASDHIQKLLKSVADHFDAEDRSVRERQIRTWRQLKLYWNGITNIWYSEVAHDWRIWDGLVDNESEESQFYNKPINVFRAYLESIIAALSVSVPSIKCAPDDADNPLDISTAKTGDKIADLIAKHNDSMLLWLHALYIFCTEGMVAAYSYPKEDDSYGKYDVKDYKDETEEAYQCPECGNRIADALFTNALQMREQMQQQNPDQLMQELQPQPPSQEFTDQITDEYMPDDTDVNLMDVVINDDAVICPACGAYLDPELEKQKFIVTRLVGITSKPKTRQCIEVYGGLYVKVPSYAMKQADIPYLRYSYETHYANVIERYPDLYTETRGQKKNPDTGVVDPYEAWGRLSTQYYGEYPINNVTVNNYWFRPCAFNVLSKEESEELKKEFPNGCKYVRVNECFADACNESLDDCWTLTYNPLSDYIQHDPLGLLLVSVQDITQELISLILQTVEHGIGQTFATPDILDFNAYKQQEVRPGDIFPTKPMTGKTIGENFFELKTATLSGEVLPFAQKIQELGQLVSGALPSLFGGQVGGGSRTAAEYSMSRSQALQRLQTPWKMLTFWWKGIFGKVIPSYIKCVQQQGDERFVRKDKQGNWINIYVRKAELEGKIGDVELEASEQLPVMWGQIKDVIMQLLQAGHPLIMEMISSPENLPFIAQALGLQQFTVPGEADRQKQYEEIRLLLDSEPMMGPDGMEHPSVDVDPLVDDHHVEAEICRIWAISDAGKMAKIDNPPGYKNVLLHMQLHMMILAQNAPPPGMVSAANPQGGQEEKPQPAAQKRGVNNAA